MDAGGDGMTHTIKGLRAQFKAVGKFHTPPELALLLRSYIPGDPQAVYDPTCGAGSLLSVFPESVEKFGQDIDQAALDDAAMLPNFHGHYGDVLTDPAWLDKRFPAIVANPPFSIKWEPTVDERFMSAPTAPTAGRADYAFLLHILHMLTDDGVAAVLSFPGVLYRGQREGALRAWMIESNWVDQVVHIPGDTFTDTSIPTAVMVLKKGRAPNAPIRFEDREHGIERMVPLDEVRGNGHNLSVSQYVQPPAPEKPPFDAWETEQAARRGICRKLRNDLQFSTQVAEFEGWSIAPFVDDLRGILDEFAAL